MSTTKPAVPAGFIPVRDAWVSLSREPIIEPDLPIIDPHHHLWDRLEDRPGTRYMLEDLLEDTGCGHNITGTVFVQCRAVYRAAGPEEMRPIGETEFVNGVAAMSASGAYGPARICAGIVGYADLRLGARVEPVLEAHIDAGGGRFRGIRYITARDPDSTFSHPAYAPPAGLLADATFREGFGRLAALNLTFDAWLFHPQIDELTALARTFPDTGIVLNHTGGPLGIGVYAGRRDEIFGHWATSIRALARCPNVFLKLGGLGMRIAGFDFHEKAMPPSSTTLATAWRPYVETAIDAFGSRRCMFESNFPVDKGSYGYATFWNACKILSHDASVPEKTDLFSGTAERFYRL
jgi:predicted TIM-barrel fold metal-dependent hydrolase